MAEPIPTSEELYANARSDILKMILEGTAKLNAAMQTAKNMGFLVDLVWREPANGNWTIRQYIVTPTDKEVPSISAYLWEQVKP